MLEVIQSDVAENKKMRDHIIASMLTHASFSSSRKHKGPSPGIIVSVCRVGLPPHNVVGWVTMGLPLPEWLWAGVQRADRGLGPARAP